MKEGSAVFSRGSGARCVGGAEMVGQTMGSLWRSFRRDAGEIRAVDQPSVYGSNSTSNTANARLGCVGALVEVQ
jgi:hypothetical protein